MGADWTLFLRVLPDFEYMQDCFVGITLLMN